MIEINNMEIREKLTQELRRGIIVLATLSQLNQAKYGYALIEELSQRGLQIDQGTLYPLLRRLEDQGLLVSEWNVEGSRPRRYYQISDTGRELLDLLSDDWLAIVKVMDDLLSIRKE
ncbi:MAG: helix-turn-helix transcriptional regulator [Chloroflexota bacterium]|nr:MAG: helix-turn-helix transcriptional regulator [Chloroflexota bacterium]